MGLQKESFFGIGQKKSFKPGLGLAKINLEENEKGFNLEKIT